MAAIFDRNSEADFLFSSVIEFMNLWKSRKDGSIKIECKEGKAFLNFTCCLGDPDDQHYQVNCPQPGKVKSKSATRRARDRAKQRPDQHQQSQHQGLSPVLHQQELSLLSAQFPLNTPHTPGRLPLSPPPPPYPRLVRRQTARDKSIQS